MNKTDLIQSIAETTRFSKAEVEAVINCTIERIRRAVRDGDDVTLVGFGTFTKTKRKARAGVNPQTGAEMKIPAMVVPRFRPGKEFKDALKKAH